MESERRSVSPVTTDLADEVTAIETDSGIPVARVYGPADPRLDPERDLGEPGAFPFTREVVDFLQAHDTIFVVEQNRDAQMKTLLMLEANDIADRLVSILHYNGMPIPSECVVSGISDHQGSEAAA